MAKNPVFTHIYLYLCDGKIIFLVWLSLTAIGFDLAANEKENPKIVFRFPYTADKEIITELRYNRSNRRRHPLPDRCLRQRAFLLRFRN